MKKILLGIGLIILAAGCSQNPPQQNTVTIENTAPAGFDVNKLAQLVKTSTDPQTLEKAINDPNSHINNLDLDKDGNVDYLKVVEPEQNHLNVVDDVSAADSVTVARIKIDPNQANNTANLNIQGDPAYAGYNNYYHSSFSFTDFLLLSYLMRPHAYYMPMYHYGYYPSYYSHYRTVRTFRTTTSPAMSSRTYRRSLSSPSGSQRSFSNGSSRPVRSGGFGTGSSSRRSFGSSSGSSRSFGSGRRSGGGRRR